jgi:DNA-binding FadR family transcriptional regulator
MAIRQHAALAEAVISGEPERAAELAAEHFKLTEETLRALHARIAAELPPSQSSRSQQ